MQRVQDTGRTRDRPDQGAHRCTSRPGPRPLTRLAASAFRLTHMFSLIERQVSRSTSSSVLTDLGLCHRGTRRR